MKKLSSGSEATLYKDMSSDFQKKITLTEHGAGDNIGGFHYGNDEAYRKMAGMF